MKCDSDGESANFAHQGGEIAFRVTEKRHPQLVIGHFGNHPCGCFELDAAAAQRFSRCANVIGFVIEDRTVCGLDVSRCPEHQSRASAIEKRHVTGFEQEFEAQSVAIEFDRSCKFFDGDRDLANRRNRFRFQLRAHARSITDSLSVHYLTFGRPE